ncbi:MAG: hypothetical protein KDD10_21490 [Phaeodactylibacter sp.]|nr:hypothetical protein [Phaeodactylibacter sp.]MCB9292349.1 hypothetical protein [Lewinellaceae bacterium]
MIIICFAGKDEKVRGDFKMGKKCIGQGSGGIDTQEVPCQRHCFSLKKELPLIVVQFVSYLTLFLAAKSLFGGGALEAKMTDFELLMKLVLGLIAALRGPK